jgi:hypothetical protein
MTRTRTAPATNIETSAPKPVTNFDRHLAILERNAANVQHERRISSTPARRDPRNRGSRGQA